MVSFQGWNNSEDRVGLGVRLGTGRVDLGAVIWGGVGWGGHHLAHLHSWHVGCSLQAHPVDVHRNGLDSDSDGDIGGDSYSEEGMVVISGGDIDCGGLWWYGRVIKDLIVNKNQSKRSDRNNQDRKHFTLLLLILQQLLLIFVCSIHQCY